MALGFESIDRRERIIVALDCDMSEALDLADELEGVARWLKIGMTLYYAHGPKIVYQLKERGFNIFLDLKFHDIPHQVEGAAASATRNGADMLTMHAIGGRAMMQAACAGAIHAADDFGLDCPVLLGITVLTSMDEEALARTGVSRCLADQVRALADQASEAGLSGVVSSPQEAASLRAALGADAYIVTPGVRPQGVEAGDQSRISTPREAFDAGASHIVIGRPITQADSPAQALLDIAETL